MARAFLGLALVAALAGSAAPAAAGVTFGPDDFGYRAETSVGGGAVTYEWVDMAGGTALPKMADDAQSALLDIGFPFVFYGKAYTQLSVLSNGIVMLAPLTKYEIFGGSQCPLPKASEVDGLVAVFERDFNPSDASCGEGCAIRHMAGGTEPNRWFGVTFDQVPAFRDPPTAPADPVTAQVLFFEGTNEIKVQVKTSSLAKGGDAVLGIESPLGLAGLSLPGCLTEGSIPDGLAVLFTPPDGGTPVVPPSRVTWNTPGQQVVDSFTVFNLEDAAVVFDLTLGGDEWPTQVSATTLTVAPGDSEDFTVTVTIPAGTSGGQADQALVTLTPQGGGDPVTAEVLTLAQHAPDAWQEAATMPLVVDSPAVAVSGTDLWLFGGQIWDELALERPVTDRVQVLHTDRMAWDHSGEGGTIAAPPAVRFEARACALGGKIYLSGGQTTEQAAPVADTLFVYDTGTNAWTEGAKMPAPRFGHAMVCSEKHGKVYVVGGLGAPDGEGNVAAFGTTWAYDPGTNAWTAGADCPVTLAYHSAQIVNDGNNILVAGGFVDDELKAATHVYGIPSDDWGRAADLQVPRLFQASALLENTFMCLIGGTTLTGTTWMDDTFECYANGYWIPQVATLQTARTLTVGATVGASMYVIGGVDTDNAYQPTKYKQYGTIERYPTTDLPPPPDAAPDAAGDVPVADAPVEDVPVVPDAAEVVDAPADPGSDPGTPADVAEPKPDVPADTASDTPVPGDTAGTDTGKKGGGGGCMAGGAPAGAGLPLLLMALLALGRARRR